MSDSGDDEEDDEEGEEGEEEEGGARGAAKKKTASLFDPLQVVAEFESPHYSARFSAAIIDLIPSANTRHVLRSPNFPMLDALLLTQLNVATGVVANAAAKATSRTHRSPKIRALLRLLKPVMKSNDGAGKAVVFSQQRAAISHVAAILKEEKIGYVKIMRGDPTKSQTEAVQKWNVDPTCHIFLLHAGTAAAGLTLTAAQQVFLLEPFNCLGEEQQALNRTHRIGQTLDVVCTTLFMRNSLEERMLAYRKRSDDLNETKGENSADLTVLSGEKETSAAQNDCELEYILGLSSTEELRSYA